MIVKLTLDEVRCQFGTSATASKLIVQRVRVSLCVCFRATRDELRLWRSVWDHPTDDAAYYQLAEFLIRTGDLSKAQSQLEEALRLRPQSPKARQTLERVSNIVRVRNG